MMKIVKVVVFALALCLLPGLVVAQSGNPTNGTGQQTNGNTSTGATSTNTGSGVSQSGAGNIVNQGGQTVEGGQGGEGGKGGSAIALSGSSSTSVAVSKQKQQQSTTVAGNGDVSISNPRQTASAYAPTIFPTASCFKGISAGAQGPMGGISFGGGKIDQNCAALEVARSFAQVQDFTAYCKVMLTNKFVKAAGVTMEDCLQQQVALSVAVAAPSVQSMPAITINVPEIPVQVLPIEVIQAASAPVQAPEVARPIRRSHVVRPCVTNENIAPAPKQ